MTQTATINDLTVDEYNVRADESTNQEELAQSILMTGLVQPIVVDQDNVVIAGHRRFAAIRSLIEEGKVSEDYEFPIVYRDTSGGEISSLQMMLVENLQREDLDPVEEARGYQRMQDEYGFKQKEIAERVGRSSFVVSRRLRLLKLPEEALIALSSGAIVLEAADEMVPVAHNREAILEMLALKLAPQQVKFKVEQLVREDRIRKVCELVDHYGGVGISDYKAMSEFNLEVHINGKSLNNPTEREIEAFVNQGEVYKVSIPHSGDVVIQETRETAVDKKQDSYSDKEKLQRAAKRKRQDMIGDIVLTTSLRAGDVRPLLNNMLANIIGSNTAKLAARYLGITKQDAPADKYGEPAWSMAIAEALDSTGVQGIRAQVAVIAAYWEQRHGAHMVQLDPNYGVLLDLLGIDLDPETLGPVEEEVADEA